MTKTWLAFLFLLMIATSAQAGGIIRSSCDLHVDFSNMSHEAEKKLVEILRKKNYHLVQESSAAFILENKLVDSDTNIFGQWTEKRTISLYEKKPSDLKLVIPRMKYRFTSSLESKSIEVKREASMNLVIRTNLPRCIKKR